MESLVKLLNMLPAEIWVGILGACVALITHRYNVSQDKYKKTVEKEDKRMHLYELELEDLADRQESIRNFMQNALEKLEDEREKLQGRIEKLEKEINNLRVENIDWRAKYNDCVYRLKNYEDVDGDYRKREI